jgi:MFS family permease
MMGIGVVMMVTAQYGSYTLAGAVSATNAVAWALGAAAMSNLVDRFGQRRVMLPGAVVSSAVLAVLVVLGTLQAPAWTLFLPAAVSGAAAGAPGALVRARWAYVLNDTSRLHTAFSLESTLDEMTFVIGPVTATALATSVAPAAGLVPPILLNVVGSLWFYSLRATEPPVKRKVVPPKLADAVLVAGEEPPRGLPLPRRKQWLLLAPGVALVATVTLLVGTLFGAMDVTVVAATESWDQKSLAGLVLGVVSLGSAIGGLGYGSRAWVVSLVRRWVVGVVFLALACLPFLVANQVVFLSVAGFVAGFAIAPTFVNLNTLMQSLVSEARLTEGLGWVSTAVGVGVSIGSTLAGVLIDHISYRAGFVAVCAAGLAAAAFTVCSARSVSRSSRRLIPPV